MRSVAKSKVVGECLKQNIQYTVLMKERKDSFRGNNLCDISYENFKKSIFYKELYKKHKDELILGIRDGYINIYYNCDSIAKIVDSKLNSQHITAEVASYYLTGESPNKKYIKVSGKELLDNYEVIKSNSNKRGKLEKQAQERLFIDNNMRTYILAGFVLMLNTQSRLQISHPWRIGDLIL